MASTKKELGQFYTEGNPFKHRMFKSWLKYITGTIKNPKLLEPFAGSNNIPKMVMELFPDNTNWGCFDIAPGNNILDIKTFPIIKLDTLGAYPIGYDVVITNPPYLAKNSATRSKEPFPITDYDDLYKVCLEKMLQNSNYVAAIIPNSFLTAGLFHNRLYCVISLVSKMFSDTDCPVCLALFVPEALKTKLELVQDDFTCYRNNTKIGLFSKIESIRDKYTKVDSVSSWIFNDPKGSLGLKALDSTAGKTIEFIYGPTLNTEIPSCKIKVSSRTATRISGIPANISLADLVLEANRNLSDFRIETDDIFLTSFKGLRKDGDFRRRLDWQLARKILDYSIEQLIKK